MSQPLDRQSAFSGTRDVPDALRFDPAQLERWMANHVPGFAGPCSVSQFKGGQSNPTYLVEAPSGRYVLRRKPPGTLLPSAHAVDREFRVLSALAEQGFPVARPYGLSDDAAITGTMFYVMDFVAGRVIWQPFMPDSAPDERNSVYDAMNSTIASLHNFDPAALGLADFGKPGRYVARQIERWGRQYLASSTEEIEEMAQLAAWLPTALPPEPRPALVHGDFRLDNCMLAPDAPRIAAVLDWELATIGDPLADFTYHLMQWVMPPSQTGGGTGSLVGHDLAALGIPSMEDYARAYAARTGLDPLAHLDFYFAYNFFRLACILQGIVGRVRDGTATNANAVALASQVRPLAHEAWLWAKRAGARA